MRGRHSRARPGAPDRAPETASEDVLRGSGRGIGGGTAAAAVAAFGRGHGNAATTALVRSVLAREPVAPVSAPTGEGAPVSTQSGAPAASPSAEPASAGTGLLGSGAVGHFLDAARQLLPRWAELATPEARLQPLFDVAVAELTAIGVPAPKLIKPLKNLGVQDGQTFFDDNQWDVMFDRAEFAVATADDAHAVKLASMVAHESRHVEQHFRALRLAATRGMKAGDMYYKEGWAPLKVCLAAAKQPLEGSGPEAAEAEVWLNLLTDDAARKASLELAARLQEARDAYLAERERFDALPPAQQTGAAAAKLERLRLAWVAASDAFNAQPTEADAHLMEEAIEREAAQPAGP